MAELYFGIKAFERIAPIAILALIVLGVVVIWCLEKLKALIAKRKKKRGE